MSRLTKQETYFKIAKDFAERSPCISRRRFGAILVKNDTVVSASYAGTVRGAINCGIDCKCLKDLYNEERYKSYEHCPSIHAEQNSIINCAWSGQSTIGATLYLSEVNDDCERPCYLCRRFMIQAGIKDCYYKNGKGEIIHEQVVDWIKLENDWMMEQLNPKNHNT